MGDHIVMLFLECGFFVQRGLVVVDIWPGWLGIQGSPSQTESLSIRSKGCLVGLLGIRNI